MTEIVDNASPEKRCCQATTASGRGARLSPGAQVCLLHGGAHEVRAGFIKLTEDLYFGRPHVAIDQAMELVERGKAFDRQWHHQSNKTNRCRYGYG